MGKRGPRPQPTKLRVLHGARPCRINDDEPQASAGAPECPEGVTAEVREIWDYTLAQLVVMDIATPSDRDALLAYCEAVVTHRRASAILASSKILIPGVLKGSVVRNPAVQIQRDAAALIRGYAQEFGFTPSARSEIRSGGHRNNEPGPERYLSG